MKRKFKKEKLPDTYSHKFVADYDREVGINIDSYFFLIFQTNLWLLDEDTEICKLHLAVYGRFFCGWTKITNWTHNPPYGDIHT